MALDVGLLIAGAKERGELELRVSGLLADAAAASDVIFMCAFPLGINHRDLDLDYANMTVHTCPFPSCVLSSKSAAFCMLSSIPAIPTTQPRPELVAQVSCTVCRAAGNCAGPG